MTFTSFQAIEILGRYQDDVVVVHNMSTSREWPVVAKDQELHLCGDDSMGKAMSIGLGIALARPDRRVWVLDGDGSLLMSLGALVTIAAAGPANFVHFVFENGVYEVTGGQEIPGAGIVDFAAMARAAGYRAAYTFDDAGEFETSRRRHRCGGGAGARRSKGQDYLRAFETRPRWLRWNADSDGQTGQMRIATQSISERLDLRNALGELERVAERAGGDVTQRRAAHSPGRMTAP